MIAQPTARSGDRLIFLALLVAALVLFCIDLGGVPLRDWDEGTVAQVAREISRGDSWRAWLHPQLFGQPYLNKPPLLHSLIAIAYTLFGVHTWTARLPGAILTACSVPLLFLLARELFPNRLPALTGTLVYLTLLPVVRHGRLAMLDGTVVCFFVALLWLLMKGQRSPRWAWGVGLCFALMVLTKGMLGVLLLAIALVFLLWADPKLFFSRPLWGGLGLGVIPIVGWYGLQWQFYGQSFLTTALGNQSLDRIWTAVEDHQGPPWYYLLELLKYSWPWLIMWPTGIWLTGRSRHHAWAKLVLVWTAGYLLVISIMGTKLPWYGYPVYPAIALTCGVALAAAWNMHRHWSRRALTIKRIPRYWGVLLAIFCPAGLAGVGYASPWGAEPSLALACTFFAIVLTTGLAAVFMLQQRLRFLPILIVGLYGSLLCLMVSDHWVWELGESFPVRPVAALIQASVPAGAPVYMDYGYERPSLNFYSDRRVMPQSPTELQTRLQQPEPAYLLVPDPTPYQAASPSLTTLGTTAGWHLIRN